MSEKTKIAEKASAANAMAAKEEEILEFWKQNEIFEKSLEKESPKGNFVFYEGPPTANGKPGIHHLEARAFKDLIPRYKTMRGYHVRRKGGWDTHGLPVELQVEKQLGLKSKKEIEKFGIAEFNKKCKESVWEYLDVWQKFTDRIGFWIDQKDPYITYKNEYIESVWSILKKVNEKELLYKDYKVVPWCPRCGTALSSHELAQGYETVKDLSVYVKLKIVGFPNAYFLAWTTTPWTLPGNVALAVGKGIEYVEAKVGDEILVLAKEKLSVISADYEIIATHKGGEMVGMQYEPLYEFSPKNENSHKVYTADFVTTEDGTGIVHTAVMYGQDDFVLGTQMSLPKFHTVDDTGHFINGTGFLEGKFVKDEETAVDIIKDLAHQNLLFKKEKYEHTYPHCWRCKTPLIYYARDSWYIRMSELRNELVKENEKINWEPSYIKEGRFGEWLREIKDWAISRERYWGTPLPIWQDGKGKNVVIGSIDELKSKTKKSGNKYFVMRHGEAEHNKLNIISNKPDHPYHLTEKGINQAKEAGEKLKNKKIDLIYCSPFLRTKETAEIIADQIGYDKEKIIYDNRLKELDFGDFDLKSFDDYVKYAETSMKDFSDKLPNGESYQDAKSRSGDFLYSTDKQNQNKNVLIVAHGMFVELMPGLLEGFDAKKSKYIVDTLDPKTGHIFEYDFVALPHNENYELDLHRPYIDELELVDKEGNKLRRVNEVVDVWLDSGAMPFAQYGLDSKDIQYPADYISEAIDQTRGWFYTLHAIGVLMGKGMAYKNVICLGHILDSEGKKMSKSVGNIVDPWVMIDKYGVDAPRFWMYSVNQPGDSKNFDERTVDEIVKKVFNILSNVLSFYLLYGDANVVPKSDSKHVLDRWIIGRLNELIAKGTDYLDRYKIFEAARLVKDFTNDLSTWYIRRSRERFKSEDLEDRNAALSTTRFVLKELAKYMAPFTPFFAEDVWQQIKNEDDLESVHLCAFPEVGEVDAEILKNMMETRKIVSLALEKRMSAGIKVRQPLQKLSIKGYVLRGKEEYAELIKDEVNVKEVVFDEKLGEEVELDTEITKELKEEGDVRELIRTIQDLRKQKGLTPDQSVTLFVDTDELGKSFINSYQREISKPTNILGIKFEANNGEELKIGDLAFKIFLNHNS
ncbi:MAG: class I tRNA ligase family protein [Patescibacteria group bacterium]